MLMLGGGIFRIPLALSPAASMFWTFASATNALVFLSVPWLSLQRGTTLCLMLTRPCAVGHPEECGAECDSASACRSFITTFFFLDGLDSACIPSWICLRFKKKRKKKAVTTDLCYILRKNTTANISALWRYFLEPLNTAGVWKCKISPGHSVNPRKQPS